MTVLDAVLRAVEEAICAPPAERGGALLGPPGVPLVTRLEPDPGARSSSASWSPSASLGRRVQALEREEGLELKGLVHSHPPGMDHPSEQDAREVAEGLRRNGHLGTYLAPIVTRGPAGELAGHELPLPSGKVSFFTGRRLAEGGAELRPVPVRALPLLRDLEAAAREVSPGALPELLLTDLGTGPLPSGRLEGAGGMELLIVAALSYPAMPPLVLATRDGRTEQLELPWRLQDREEERLVLGLRAALPALDRGALFARSAGILPRALAERRVLVAGCGSVGSYMAEALARSGVGAFTLVDPERVEGANLSRSVYEARDVGTFKVEALARRLRAVSPTARVDSLAGSVQDLAPADLDQAVRAADLVVAATDDPAAQRALNRFAYARGRPALFVGLYAGAEGGEVVLSAPERTPCFLCATGARHRLPGTGGGISASTGTTGTSGSSGGPERLVDYGSGRLQGESAIAADIHHVASAGVKLGLSLLSAGEEGARLAGFTERVIAAGTPYLTLSTVPDYWFYPQLFGEVPGQLAFQSVWLTVIRDEACPVCGPPELREDPLAVPLRPPTRGAFDMLIEVPSIPGRNEPV